MLKRLLRRIAEVYPGSVLAADQQRAARLNVVQEAVQMEVRTVNITPSAASGRIAVKSLPEDAPEWRRQYSATFSGGFRIEVELRSSYGNRYDSSVLIQPNGKRVYFDLRAVADKIIDRELCPVVLALADEIKALDAVFMKSDRLVFTDKHGDAWQRVA